MGRKPKIQTRIEHDTEEAVEQYLEENEANSQSEAIRHLIRAGLGHKGYPVAASDGGELLTRLERIEQRQEEIGQQQNVLAAGTMFALVYVAITLALSISSVWWSAIGVIALLVILAYRWWEQ